MDRFLLLHLSLITKVGPAKIEQLLQKCGDTVPDLYSFSVPDFQKLGLSEQVAQTIVAGLADKTYLEKELQLLEKHAINWCTVFDPEYPERLKAIHLPPPVLYWQGDLKLPEYTVAFVGSRAKSSYGNKVVQSLIPDLVTAEFTIMSGGALGIDTAAHQATIDAGGKTVAVLGSGLLEPYPAANKKLFEKIVHTGGAVISTFPLQFAALPQNFPARNRIVSGLSDGCVVVRAAVKSGALITAEYALQQGKAVFAVPGPVDDPLSAGCHQLLRQGACLVETATDIFDELCQGVCQQSLFSESQPVIIKKEQHPLVMLCQQPKTLDELLQATQLTEFDLNDQLFELQLEGKISQNFAGLWQSA